MIYLKKSQILLIILLKEFMKLNANMDVMTKNCHTRINKYRDFECCLEYTNVKDDLKLWKYLSTIGIKND